MMANEQKRLIFHSTQFRKDLRLAFKQGKDLKLLERLIDLLAEDKPLPEKHHDHALQGNWKGFRECHITPDYLLVYRKTDKNGLVLLLARLASHSELDF